MPGAPPTLRLVVIQASPFCNIDCRYCYLPGRSSTKLMEEPTLERILQRVFDSSCLGESVDVVWHAGEPLAVPISFYERASGLLAQYNRKGVRVRQSIQTNAMLITQEWCDFFRSHQIHVGVSIDGPQWLHDAHRVTRGGRGTFERAMAGVRLLQENGIPVHNIAVLTSDALDHADELWDFFVKNGFDSLAFNVEEQEGVHERSSVNDPADADRYRRFFHRMQQLRRSWGARKVAIRELDDMEDRIRAVSGEIDCTLNSPLSVLNFDCDGNFSTFSPEMLTARSDRHGDFRFGNVFTSGIDEILAHDRFRAVHEEIERGIARCRDSCPYFSVCGGGDPSNKLAENGTFDSTETVHCRLTIQALCDVVLEGVEESLGIAGPAAADGRLASGARRAARGPAPPERQALPGQRDVPI